jgi:hypothetical protein
MGLTNDNNRLKLVKYEIHRKRKSHYPILG